MSIVWIRPETVLAIHRRQIAEHGGSEGLRDEGLLLSALARPQNLRAYGESVDIAALAAAYTFGIAKNHPFIDGNKRTALVVMRTFLAVNKVNLGASPEAKFLAIISVADGSLDETGLAGWVRQHIVSN